MSDAEECPACKGSGDCADCGDAVGIDANCDACHGDGLCWCCGGAGSIAISEETEDDTEEVEDE